MRESQINLSWKYFVFQDKEWFHEDIKGSDTLLVTVGDSWTWGDKLGRINPTANVIDDYDYRIKNVYGYLLSNQLGVDWVNIGICGASILHIAITTKKFLDSMSKNYNKIIVLFSLPEIGRDLSNNNFLDQEEEYNIIKGSDWPSFNDVVNGTEVSNILSECFEQGIDLGYNIELFYQIKDAQSVDEFIEQYESYIIKLLNRMFNDPIIVSCYTKFNNLTAPWTSIIADQGNLEKYPANAKVVYNQGLDGFLRFANKFPKEQLISVLDSADQARKWFLKSPYGADSGHPLEQSHIWWADFLYKIISR